MGQVIKKTRWVNSKMISKIFGVCNQGCIEFPSPPPLGEYNQAVGEVNQVEKKKGSRREGGKGKESYKEGRGSEEERREG